MNALKCLLLFPFIILKCLLLFLFIIVAGVFMVLAIGVVYLLGWLMNPVAAWRWHEKGSYRKDNRAN